MTPKPFPMLVRHPTISVKAIASRLGISERHVYRAIEGMRSPSLRELQIGWFPEIRRAADGVEIIEQILGVNEVNLEVRPIAAATPSVDILMEAALRASAEVGELGGDVLRAAQDGRLDHSERQEIRGDARRLRRIADEIEAAVESVPDQQLAFKRVPLQLASAH